MAKGQKTCFKIEDLQETYEGRTPLETFISLWDHLPSLKEMSDSHRLSSTLDRQTEKEAYKAAPQKKK
jgi:hypothetical protein